MVFFDEVYQGCPPWDIGRAQREFATLETSGDIVGDVLDVGCGTGENALYLAECGHEVWGVDAATRAIEMAREKARNRRITVTFVVGDALDLGALDRTFDTVVDSGFFHTLADSDRPRFAQTLSTVLPPGGTYIMLAFSDLVPGEFELPRRVAQVEIRATFSRGWRVECIRPAIFEHHLQPEGSPAWLSRITRT